MLKTLIQQITDFTTQPGFRLTRINGLKGTTSTDALQFSKTSPNRLTSEVERIRALYELIEMGVKQVPNSQIIKDVAVFGSDNDTLSGEITITTLSLYAPLIDSDKSKQYRTPKYRYKCNDHKCLFLDSSEDENY
jgi:hypothetical protein